jgi:hypothetical protein
MALRPWHSFDATPVCVLQVPDSVDKRRSDPKINDIDDWFRYGGADASQLGELIVVALAYPRKPTLILPSAGVPIISCAETLFKALAKQKQGNNLFPKPGSEDLVPDVPIVPRSPS